MADMAGVLVIFCFFGIALAVSWASQPRPAKILRRFNGLWKERIAVELFGGLWLVRQRLLSTLGCRFTCLSVSCAASRLGCVPQTNCLKKLDSLPCYLTAHARQLRCANYLCARQAHQLPYLCCRPGS